MPILLPEIELSNIFSFPDPYAVIPLILELITVLLYTLCPWECIRYIPSFAPVTLLLNTVTLGPVPCLTSIPWFTAFTMLLLAIRLFGVPKFIIPVV